MLHLLSVCIALVLFVCISDVPSVWLHMMNVCLLSCDKGHTAM